VLFLIPLQFVYLFCNLSNNTLAFPVLLYGSETWIINVLLVYYIFK
jgi:hypothetical protein